MHSILAFDQKTRTEGDMPRLFTYVIPNGEGFAPNSFHDVCTLNRVPYLSFGWSSCDT